MTNPRNASGRTEQDQREAQIYYEDGKAYRQAGTKWVRAPESDVLTPRISLPPEPVTVGETIDKQWRTPEGAIVTE